MTENIEIHIMGMEHMMKQPSGRRYALFCKEAFARPSQTDCDAKSTMGHIADFSDYSKAREIAIPHPHDAMIRFYPDIDNEIPTDDFIKDHQTQLTNKSQSF